MSDDDFPSDRKTGTASFPMAGSVIGGEFSHAEEPMTEVQAVRLRQLCDEKGEPFDSGLTREQADARIAALQEG